jgi:uncharacterized protein (DUF1778 family)
MKRSRGRPKKEKPMETTLKIRLEAEQRDLIERAGAQVTAERGSKNVSAWVRETLLERAREVLGEKLR